MKKIITICFLLSLFAFQARAQGFDGIYSTIDGLIEVRGVYNDSFYRAYSNRLRVSLNYDNASIQLNLDLTTLKTGVDSTDAFWHRMLSGRQWQLKGKLSLQYINTETSANEPLTLDGYLTNENGTFRIRGDGELRHVAGDPIACMLTLNIVLNLPDLGITCDDMSVCFDPDVMVNIQQSVLKR